MKRALFFWGGWSGHEPQQCAEFMSEVIAEEDFEVDLTENLEVLADKEQLDSYDLIVPVVTMSEISGEQAKGLCAAIRDGVGLAGWHGGMGDTFRGNTEYQFMVGGQFVAHPGNIIDYKVDILAKDDPLMEGLEGFTHHSEQYYMHVDPSNEVLVTTTFTGEYDGVDWIAGTVMPVVWKRQYGKGRVFYSALGHVASEFEIEPVREIMKRGMIWAAR